MYIPKEWKLNKFKHVAIPNGKELFQKFGLTKPNEMNFTGDEVIPNIRKIDSIADMDAYDKMMQEEELKAEKAKK